MQFLPQRGKYRSLIAFQKSECIYDVTYHFAHRFLSIGDRTIDQMIQAARSGKQNIAEGSMDSTTSKEMEIKLFNVARASLHELMLDYEDYLRVRGLSAWQIADPRMVQLRKVCKCHNESAFYRERIGIRSDVVIANLALTLIHQADCLLRELIEYAKTEFLHNGGIKEQMYKARIEQRNNNRG